MKTYYAIKTERGYLATQGNTIWYQAQPAGWAEYCSEDHARQVADQHAEFPYTIVEVDGDTATH